MLTLTLLGVLSPLPAMAYEMEGDLTHYPPVSEEILDSLRGGFQFGPKGPVMSFGIERDVFLNHKLVSSTAFNIPDVTRFAASPSNAFTLIQHGSGNSAPHNLSSLPPLTTVIQNTLDNQAIQTHTVINATVAALMWARALDLGHALSQANIGAIQH
jgi:hypothetical protein